MKVIEKTRMDFFIITVIAITVSAAYLLVQMIS